MVAVISASPKAVMMANMLRLVVLAGGGGGGGGKKDDQSYTKNLQDGPPRVTFGNGPKQD